MVCSSAALLLVVETKLYPQVPQLRVSAAVPLYHLPGDPNNGAQWQACTDATVEAQQCEVVVGDNQVSAVGCLSAREVCIPSPVQLFPVPTYN